MGFEEVIWKWEERHQQTGWIPVCHWSSMAGCFKMHGKRLEPISGKRLQCSQLVCRRSELRKKMRIPGPHRPLAAAVHVCVCHRLTEVTNRVVGERPAQPESLCKKPRGASGGVLPAWATKGAIQPPPAFLEVMDWDWTSRSLSVGDFRGVGNEFEHKEKEVKEVLTVLPVSAQQRLDISDPLPEYVKGSCFPKAVCLVVYLLLEKIGQGCF